MVMFLIEFESGMSRRSE